MINYVGYRFKIDKIQALGILERFSFLVENKNYPKTFRKDNI